MQNFRIVGMSRHDGYCTAELVLHDKDQTEVVAHDLFGSWMIGEPKKKTPQREPLAFGIDPAILQAHKAKLGDGEPEEPKGLPKPRVPKFKSGSKVEILTGTVEANSGPKPTRVHMDEVELMDEETFEASKKIPIGQGTSEGHIETKVDPGWEQAVAEQLAASDNHIKVDALAPAKPKRVPRKKSAPAAAPAPTVAAPKKRLPRVKT
jgi:hypothetical protein